MSHDCALDKEFNEAYSELLSVGTEPEVARKLASSNPKLDEFAVVAPIMALSEIPKGRRDGIERKIGYFGLKPTAELGAEPVVDLSRISTVDHRLLRNRQLSLSDHSIGILRYKLVELFAYRSSTFDKLERMVGARLVDVTQVKKNKDTIRATLLFEGGLDTIVLDVKGSLIPKARAPEVLRDESLRSTAKPYPKETTSARILKLWNRLRHGS